MSYVPEHLGEAAAVRARRQWDLGLSRPIDDLLGFVEKTVGIPVLIERFAADNIAGVLLRHADDSSFIAINADLLAPRQRFTLAHELGHFAMDHQPRVDYVDNLVEGRAGDSQEVQANYFAAEFLCPRQAVNDWMDRHGVGEIDADVAARVAMEFGLGFPTACFRLERAGAVSTAMKQQLLARLSADPGTYVRRYTSARLLDEIERMDREERSGGSAYPRLPLATRMYADQALEQDLIDDEEHTHLVGAPDDRPDFAAWVS